MNRDCHRIVFNKHRGQRMAVAETTHAGGKGATGEPLRRSGVSPSRMRTVAVAMWLAVGALPMAWAQVIADPAAPANQRPTVLSDSAGRPLVHVQTPSAAGLSRNTYKQFDVQANGIVLNNSATNPWMANGVLAKTILNEVNSTSQSFINGAITVNGAAAQVIVANPNGITVNGGSFVNAHRATLTTGTAQVANGVLTGFDVRRGGVTIGSGGLNSSATPYTDILSRTVTLAGALRAQELGITTGLQSVDYATGLISNQDTNTYLPAGSLAIDTAGLGGMYAGNISIVATEAGLGVRNWGYWQANGGHIVVTADGNLSNDAVISADVVSLATVKGDIVNSRVLQGSKAVVLSAGGDVRMHGAGLKQSTGSTIIVSAKGAVTLQSNPYHGAAEISSTAGGGQVNISAGGDILVGSGATVAADKDVQLSTDATLRVNASSITSNSGNVTALAGNYMVLADSKVTGRQVHLETGSAFKDTTSHMNITRSDIRGQTQATVLATGSMVLGGRVSAALVLPGGLSVGSIGNVHIQAGQAVSIQPDSQVTANNHMSVVAGDSLNIYGANAGIAAPSDGSPTPSTQTVYLGASGNMLVSGKSVSASGSSLWAARDLSIEASDGNINLNALLYSTGSNLQPINLYAGNDLNVSAFMGNINATGLKATGKNINLMSNGANSVANAVVRSNVAVPSTLTAIEDITIGAIGTIGWGQATVMGSTLTAGGQARMISSGSVTVGAPWNLVDENNAQSRSRVTGGSVAAQGQFVHVTQTDIRANGDKSSSAKSGDITLNGTAPSVGAGPTPLVVGINAKFDSTGNIALHSNGKLYIEDSQANSGRGLSVTSALGGISTSNASLTARDMLSIASKGLQSHERATYVGGAVSMYNEIGDAVLSNTRVSAQSVLSDPDWNLVYLNLYGQLSLESGGAVRLDPLVSLNAKYNLSLIQGQGDIAINYILSNMDNLTDTYDPATYNRGTLALSQLVYGSGLTLGTRNGNLKLSGYWRRVDKHGVHGVLNNPVYIPAEGDINLFANNVFLEGSYLRAGRTLNITATSGVISATALKFALDTVGFTNSSWAGANLTGTTGVNLKAAQNIAISSASISSDGSVNMQSGGNITIEGKYTSRYGMSGAWRQDETDLVGSRIRGNMGVSIGAVGGSLKLNTAEISASAGKLSLQALGQIDLEAGQSHKLHTATTTRSESSWLGLSEKEYVTYHHREYLQNRPIWLQAQDIEIKAGNSLNTYGTKFLATRNLSLQAGDAINYYAVYDQQVVTDTTYKTSSFLGFDYSSSTTTDSTSKLTGQPTQLQSLGDILSNSGGNQLLQGTQVAYGGTASFNAGVGEKARADARIILEGLKNSTTQTRTKESNYVVWQKMVSQGTHVESLAMPSFTGPRVPTFTAPGGLSVQIPEGDFKAQIVTLGRQPGMAYLNTLAARTDVNWQPVKLAFDQWNYKQEGLTAAGAALLAVAVAWALPPGVGANLIGANTGGATALMANAAFTSLASQAAISFVNNKGDIGKTLKDLGSSQTVKATIAAALTAGVLEKLGATGTMKDLAEKTGFSEKLTYNLINASGRALTNTAITGGSLEDALKAALIGGLVDTAHGQAASVIKGLESEYLAHKLAHALAGCVAGVAAGGSCKDGAIGAAVGEIIAGPGGLIKPANGMFYTAEEKHNVLALTKLVGGAVSAYAGGNAQTAIATAETAVSNNAFFVPPLVYWLAAAAGAYTTGVGGGNPLDGLQTIGNGNDPLSKAMANGTQAAVALSMSQFPAETRAALNLLSAAGQQVDATLTYLDSRTGQVVSTQWNGLSADTRATLIGAGKVTGVVFSPVGVGQVKNLVLNAPKAVGEQAKTLAVQNMIRDAGAVDPATGKPILNLQELAKQPGGLTNLKEATGDLFGSATMQSLFKDATYVGGMKLGEKGLDAVYKVNSPDVDFLFVEYKYNTSRQGVTGDGLQASMSWVTGSQRIENAVGREIAPIVRASANAGRTETLLIQTLPDGRTNVKLLDINGKSIHISQSKLELVERITGNLNRGIAP
jgi:filamentous hemagglutinin